jgi:hypothetical protein
MSNLIEKGCKLKGLQSDVQIISCEGVPVFDWSLVGGADLHVLNFEARGTEKIYDSLRILLSQPSTAID